VPVTDDFTSKDLLRLVPGMTYRQLDYWCSTRLLVPSKGAARGSGTSRRFGLPDVVAARVLIELREQGFSLQQLRKVTRELSRNKRKVANPISAHRLVVVPGAGQADLAVAITDEEGNHLQSVLGAPGQTVVALAPISAEVQEAARTIALERNAEEFERREAKKKADRERYHRAKANQQRSAR
jgi:DNA-binding transcriptional MerR regulator